MFNGTLYADDAHYPQADQFIPERWLRDEKIECPVRRAHETHPFVYLPFGHGPRACPGMRFANMEMETLIARVNNNSY
jgi:cytochrome P450